MKNSKKNTKYHKSAAKTASTADPDTKNEILFNRGEDIVAIFDTIETRAMLEEANKDSSEKGRGFVVGFITKFSGD